MKKNVDISKYSTMKIGGKVPYLQTIKNISDIEQTIELASKHKTKIKIIGGGSNTVFGAQISRYLFCHMKIKGINITKETEKHVYIEVGAGENWDRFVDFTTQRNISGAEALSSIPGTVGASPIQNIGAYGSEVKDTIILVEAYDTTNKKFMKLKNKDCHFSYRNSIFKKQKDRFIIHKVTFKLNKNKYPKIPKYPDVQKYFLNKKRPDVQEIRKAIIEIRKNKLPNPKLIPNCGSFFKNPFINKSKANKLKKQFKDIKIFESEEGLKVGAGFLIDKLGFKGKTINNIVIYKNNALVLTNPNKAKFKDLIKAKQKIEKEVFKKFGIRLETEVDFVI